MFGRRNLSNVLLTESDRRREAQTEAAAQCDINQSLSRLIHLLLSVAPRLTRAEHQWENDSSNGGRELREQQLRTNSHHQTFYSRLLMSTNSSFDLVHQSNSTKEEDFQLPHKSNIWKSFICASFVHQWSCQVLLLQIWRKRRNTGRSISRSAEWWMHLNNSL